MTDQDIKDRASTLTWNVEGLEELLLKLNLTELEAWIIGQKIDALKLSIKMLREKAGVSEEDAGS